MKHACNNPTEGTQEFSLNPLQDVDLGSLTVDQAEDVRLRVIEADMNWLTSLGLDAVDVYRIGGRLMQRTDALLRQAGVLAVHS